MLGDILLGTGQVPGTKNDLATVLMLKKPAKDENTAHMRPAGRNGETKRNKQIFSAFGPVTLVHQVEL